MAGTRRAGRLARASRPPWPVPLRVGVLEALAGALDHEDRAVVAACQVPRALRGHIRAPGASATGRRVQGPYSRPPGRQRRAWQCCPAPPRLTPAQQQAEVATGQAADCPRPSVWTTQPPAISCWASLVSLRGIGADRAAAALLCRPAGCGGSLPPGAGAAGLAGGRRAATAQGSSATLSPLPAGRRGACSLSARSPVRQGCPAPCGDVSEASAGLSRRGGGGS